MTLFLEYKDTYNHKTRLVQTVHFKYFPEARNLVEGGEILMGEFGTPTQEVFFNSKEHPYLYDEDHDHDVLKIVQIRKR